MSFASGLNLVVGRNAQGKTNLLEAVYCLSGLGSPRGPDSALIHQGAENALIHATVARRGRVAKIDLELRPARAARALVNGTALRSARALGETCVSVFFGPDELSLVKGSPEGRRRFLDDLIVKMRPAQAKLRREWERVLKQRNALLKEAPFRGGRRVAPATQEVWDEAFCRAGGALAAARLRALAALVPHASRRYTDVAQGGELRLGYVSSWLSAERSDRTLVEPGSIDEGELAEALEKRLEEVRERELERGISLAGPGRDDIGLRLRAESIGALLDARAYASQGDQRTTALALKLAEHDLLTEVLGDTPVLLLDDVFSELDPGRRGWLQEAVIGSGQTLLSTTEAATVESLRAEQTMHVESGTVSLIG
jgi:DNA replication and repair protein RecF